MRPNLSNIRNIKNFINNVMSGSLGDCSNITSTVAPNFPAHHFTSSSAIIKTPFSYPITCFKQTSNIGTMVGVRNYSSNTYNKAGEGDFSGPISDMSMKGVLMWVVGVPIILNVISALIVPVPDKYTQKVNVEEVSIEDYLITHRIEGGLSVDESVWKNLDLMPQKDIIQILERVLRYSQNDDSYAYANDGSDNHEYTSLGNANSINDVD